MMSERALKDLSATKPSESGSLEDQTMRAERREDGTSSSAASWPWLNLSLRVVDKEEKGLDKGRKRPIEKEDGS